MKSVKFTVLLVVALTLNVGIVTQVYGGPSDPVTAPVRALKPPIVINSPRHPATFYLTGNDKLCQDLRWDKETQTLSAYVSYSMIDGVGDTSWDPADCQTFKLPFPSVSLDQKNNLFVDVHKRKILLGHVQDGTFDGEVKLNDQTQLIAHRHDGRLSARLVVQ